MTAVSRHWRIYRNAELPERPSPARVSSMLAAGLTCRDIAKLFNVDDRVIESMMEKSA